MTTFAPGGGRRERDRSAAGPAALASGERVLHVPAKLAARARVPGHRQGRKTDSADAHAIVVLALRDKKLREVTADPDRTVLRLLCDRRDELSSARAQALNRLQRLFLELIPGGAPVKKSAAQYRALLATVRPRDLAGKTRRRVAAEELAGIERLDATLTEMKAELTAAVLATGSHLMDIYGVGPAVAARILAGVGDVARFPNRAHFASWTGTAPTGASSGQHTHHRLSRAGNRRLYHVLSMAGIVQLRNDTPGRAYYRRRVAEGKTSLEAMRCLRRRLSAWPAASTPPTPQTQKAGPGGHPGATLSSSAVGLLRASALRISHFPEPHPRRYPCRRGLRQLRGPGRRYTATARRRCHRAAPHRTNDVDTGQRRRTLEIAGAAPLTTTRRFLGFEDLILRFATRPDLDIFSNNEAERTIRPVKVQQRSSGSSWRTLEGLADFALVQSYLSTAAKWGLSKLDALRGLFSGHAWLPPGLEPAG